MKIKIFADGADLKSIQQLAKNPLIKGFTTNPTLMRKAGITDYEGFAQSVLKIVDLPVSFEIFSDDPEGMEEQARIIAQWGKNVYVKIPITNTKGESCAPLIKTLSQDGIQLNITALMLPAQVSELMPCFTQGIHNYVSVFAGRIADTGRDPLPIMRECLSILSQNKSLELIWASPREFLNIVQADEIGCQVITVTNDLIQKLPLLGKDLSAYSLETVQMFHRDAIAAGISLPTDKTVRSPAAARA